jgi:hypothetical protein
MGSGKCLFSFTTGEKLKVILEGEEIGNRAAGQKIYSGILYKRLEKKRQIAGQQ